MFKITISINKDESSKKALTKKLNRCEKELDSLRREYLQTLTPLAKKCLSLDGAKTPGPVYYVNAIIFDYEINGTTIGVIRQKIINNINSQIDLNLKLQTKQYDDGYLQSLMMSMDVAIILNAFTANLSPDKVNWPKYLNTFYFRGEEFSSLEDVLDLVTSEDTADKKRYYSQLFTSLGIKISKDLFTSPQYCIPEMQTFSATGESLRLLASIFMIIAIQLSFCASPLNIPINELHPVALKTGETTYNAFESLFN